MVDEAAAVRDAQALLSAGINCINNFSLKLSGSSNDIEVERLGRELWNHVDICSCLMCTRHEILLSNQLYVMFVTDRVLVQ